MKCFGAILILLVVSLLADADCRARVVYQQQHVAPYVAPVVQQIYAAQYVPLLVPTYSVTYHDPTAAITAELQQLRREVQQLRAPAQSQQVPPQSPMSRIDDKPQGGKVDVLKIFSAKCATCHDKTNASKGGGFSFLEGGTVGTLNFKQALKISTKLARNEMPPGKEKLSDDEYQEVISWLDGLK